MICPRCGTVFGKPVRNVVRMKLLCPDCDEVIDMIRSVAPYVEENDLYMATVDFRMTLDYLSNDSHFGPEAKARIYRVMNEKLPLVLNRVRTASQAISEYHSYLSNVLSDDEEEYVAQVALFALRFYGLLYNMTHVVNNELLGVNKQDDHKAANTG